MARCDDLEQYSRGNNIRIIGVPETAEESADEITIFHEAEAQRGIKRK